MRLKEGIWAESDAKKKDGQREKDRKQKKIWRQSTCNFIYACCKNVISVVTMMFDEFRV